MVKAVLRYLLMILGFAVAGILLFASVVALFRLNQLVVLPDGFHPDKFERHYADHLVLAYVHIIPGMLFLILGLLQFIPYIRNRFPVIHRFIGKTFLILSIVIFTTALVLGLFYPFGDWIESSVTVAFGIFLLYCVVQAYRMARAKKFKHHRNWVIRIYFIAISVSTIRGIVALFLSNSNSTMQEVFGVSFLIAFLFHSLMVELYIRYLAR